MMPRLVLSILLLLGLSSVSWAETNLCGQIVLKEGKLKLSENEKVMICGSNHGGDGWKEIPIPQAQLHLTSVLQSLGYLTPRFERDENHLQVWSGPRSETKKLILEGASPELLPIDKKRQIVGFPLMPEKLNEVQTWADLRLRSQGHACPKVNLTAQGWDQVMNLKADPGPRQKIRTVDYEGLENLEVESLQRYQPFEVGEWYDVRKTQLMISRMSADGLFQSVYFTTDCQEENVDLKLHTSIGKPRLLQFGIGGSSEEFPFIDVSLRNTRLDDRASLLRTDLHLSPVLQSLAVNSELYWIDIWPKIFFGPRFRLAREIERSHELLTAKTGADIGRNWDQWDLRFQGRAGPTLNYSKTVAGIGPSDVTFLTLEGSLAVMDHPYELFLRDQYDGWNGRFAYRGQRKGLGAPINVDRYELDFKYLWNIESYSPPLLVLGTRVDAVMVDSDALQTGGEGSAQLIPVDYRIQYGGDRNLRGFSRGSLNNGGLGYLNSVYLGWELRLIEELPWKLQPFLLWDLAKLGATRGKLDAPLFSSEGLGLRWASPFGTLRASAARGRIFAIEESSASTPQQWVYFVSFGQEF